MADLVGGDQRVVPLLDDANFLVEQSQLEQGDPLLVDKLGGNGSAEKLGEFGRMRLMGTSRNAYCDLPRPSMTHSWPGGWVVVIVFGKGIL